MDCAALELPEKPLLVIIATPLMLEEMRKEPAVTRPAPEQYGITLPTLFSTKLNHLGLRIDNEVILLLIGFCIIFLAGFRFHEPIVYTNDR